MKYIKPVGSEEQEFCRHICDLIVSSEKNNRPKFSSFLTEREQQLALYEANSLETECMFWGGYTDASRKIFAVNIKDTDDFPLKALTFSFRQSDKLTHRDFLGAIMSLGLKRSSVGDIKVSEDKAVVFILENVSFPLLTEIRKVGNVGISIFEGIKGDLPRQEYENISLIVSSERIDAIVSAVCGKSREKALSMIKSGFVVLNGIQVDSPSKKVEIDDIFSVKGYGKYILSNIGGVTKKGKDYIEIKKYK